MAEEYIIKTKDSFEVIAKEQWDGVKDDKTRIFIPLGQGKDREIIYDANGEPVDIKDYQVTFGLIFDINNERDPGYLFYLYKDDNGKYSGEWVRMIRGALRLEVKAQLRKRKAWEAITAAVNTIIDPEALTEFKKIIESIALGNVIYEYLEDREIEIEELNAKEYFYRIYKYALKGQLDKDTFNSIIGIEYSDDWVVLDYNSVESIQFRTELAYERIANKN